MDIDVSDLKDKTQPLEIVLYPDPFLKKPCRKITPDEIKKGVAGGWNLAELVEQMKVTMYAAAGIGLAAPQVGVGLRLFIWDISGDKSGVFALLNPVINDPEGSITEEEGCLSIPHVRAKVKRHEMIRVNGVDLKGKVIEFEADDLLARVCQHEIDHLDGKLFIDKLGAASRFLIRRQLAELEDDYEMSKKKMTRK